VLSNFRTSICRLTAERGVLVRSNRTVLDVVAEEIIANTLAAVRTSLEPRRTLPRRCTTTTTSAILLTALLRRGSMLKYDYFKEFKNVLVFYFNTEPRLKCINIV